MKRSLLKLIHDTFTQPDTCILGYNSIRFDDEVTRNIFYRNFTTRMPTAG